MAMSFAPRHDYERIERVASTARLRWAKSASPEAKFDRYAELLALTTEVDKPRLKLANARQRWLREKREHRMKLLAILEHLEHKRG
jgi:hypothetical protein